MTAGSPRWSVHIEFGGSTNGYSVRIFSWQVGDHQMMIPFQTTPSTSFDMRIQKVALKFTADNMVDLFHDHSRAPIMAIGAGVLSESVRSLLIDVVSSLVDDVGYGSDFKAHVGRVLLISLFYKDFFEGSKREDWNDSLASIVDGLPDMQGQRNYDIFDIKVNGDHMLTHMLLPNDFGNLLAVALKVRKKLFFCSVVR